MAESVSILCCRPLDYRTAKTGGAVNGGAFMIEDLNELDTDNYFKFVDYALANKVSECMVPLDCVL